ncbi:Hypothetical protein D9617_10g073950 [Elsinoe fawcettii]|nr:Hypothetical protein D9617_10g073950 [Elsinoe fawcettii]
MSTDTGGHRKISVRAGQVERCKDGNHSRLNVFDFYYDEQEAVSLETAVDRVLCTIFESSLASERLKAVWNTHDRHEIRF